ncbi:hypothetical protein OGY35_23825 [Citrobacter sp. Ct235]|uniref:hypothetical protein n=1 Tax=Citrobacter sp. Ct235 TaxID=2985157 RepID=UPI0025777482|nr:hypothetical protein [Citrobacter sp. Ct235]MDM2738385.1 hypothetical protein [Citrobacter sp. Ct235]
MIVTVKNLNQFGMISDIPSFETPINAWTTIKNCSLRRGSIGKSGNIIEVMVPSQDTVNKMYPKNGLIYFGTKDKLYVDDGFSNRDVSRTTAYTTTNEWFFTELSDILIAVNNTNTPQMLKGNASNFEDLTKWGYELGAQHDWKANKMIGFKNFLIAWGMVEDGVEFKQRVRWSNIALPNEVPNSWDASDQSTSAGFNDLSEMKGESQIIDMVPYNDFLIIYTTREAYLMTYTGGDSIFSFRKIFDNISLISPECAVATPKGHIVVTNDDIILHNTQEITSLIENKIKLELFNVINQGNTKDVLMQYYPAKNEVWVLYPSTINQPLNRAVILSLDSLSWVYRDVNGVTSITYGVIPSEKNKVINAQDYVINTDPRSQVPINGIGQDFIKQSLVVSSANLSFYAVDEGLVTANTLPAMAEKRYMDFDDYGFESTSHKQIKSIYPHVRGEGIINITIGVSESPYIEPTWTKTKQFNIKTDRKIDFRVTGRYISIRFESFDGLDWDMPSFEIELEPNGIR